jgi:ABC-2 type transport system ATP-binding protein
VFLTTQYLEEADQLAGRIAIIDGGRIVREGEPNKLKAAVGAPTLRLQVPEAQLTTAEEVLARFGPERPDRAGVLAIGLEGGATEVTAVVRALDQAGVEIDSMELNAPSLDDVFVEATGHRLEGGSPDEEEPAA